MKLISVPSGGTLSIFSVFVSDAPSSIAYKIVVFSTSNTIIFFSTYDVPILAKEGVRNAKT